MKKIFLISIMFFCASMMHAQFDFNNQFKYRLVGSSPQVKNLWKYNYCADTLVISDSVWVCDTVKVLQSRNFIAYELCDSVLVSTDTLAAGGGGGDNLGDHTATNDLDMDEHKINNVGLITEIDNESYIDLPNDEIYLNNGSLTLDYIYSTGFSVINIQPGTSPKFVHLSPDGLDGPIMGWNSSDGSYMRLMGDRPTLIDEDVLIFSELKAVIHDSTSIKSDTGHVHTIADVTGLSSALSSKSNVGHGHSQSEITGLVTDLGSINSSLAGKSNTGHTHSQSDVSGLTSALNSKHALIQIKDEGTNQGGAGDATNFNFTGGGVTASVSGATTTINIPGSAAAGGSNGQVQYNLAGSLEGATKLEVDDNTLKLVTGATVTKDSNSVIVGTEKIVGGLDRMVLYDKDNVHHIEPDWFRESRIIYSGIIGNTWNTLGALGTVLGTHSSVTLATTNVVTRKHRSEFTQTASTSAVSGWRSTSAVLVYTDSGTESGFRYSALFAFGNGMTTASRRSFTGLWTSTSNNTDIDISSSSLTNAIGVGFDAGDSDFQIFHNDGSGSPTKVDTSIPKPTTNNDDIFLLEIYQKPNQLAIDVKLTNLTTTTTYSATVNSDLPANNSLLALRGWMGAGGTSTATNYVMFKTELVTRNL